ncbi:MAG: hypothetical protein DME50_02905 [Verrucomicrobia bacterium]|nr:MAG: hypothetical protein DME50_02905 [Verrucomicrobiota bacterium]
MQILQVELSLDGRRLRGRTPVADFQIQNQAQPHLTRYHRKSAQSVNDESIRPNEQGNSWAGEMAPAVPRRSPICSDPVWQVG